MIEIRKLPQGYSLRTGVLLGVLAVASVVVPGFTVRAEERSVLVQIEPAGFHALSETLTAYGTIEYAPEQGQVLDVQAEGLVSKVNVAAGQRVRKGDVLVELTVTENVKTELEHARIAANYARKDVERVRDLRTRQLATNAEVQLADENLAKAESALANVLHRVGAGSKRQLKAGMNGVVEVITVHEGDIAAPGVPLLRLAHSERLQVRLGVEPEDLPRLREGQSVRVAPLHMAAQSLVGHIRHIYYQVDPKTRLAEVVVPLIDAPNLLPGAVVRGEIILSERQGVLAVPRQAVLDRGGKAHVFVAEHGQARLRFVDAGLDDGQFVEIRTGLQPNEPVVVLGNHELEEGMALRPQDGL